MSGAVLMLTFVITPPSPALLGVWRARIDALDMGWLTRPTTTRMAAITAVFDISEDDLHTLPMRGSVARIVLIEHAAGWAWSVYVPKTATLPGMGVWREDPANPWEDADQQHRIDCLRELVHDLRGESTLFDTIASLVDPAATTAEGYRKDGPLGEAARYQQMNAVRVTTAATMLGFWFEREQAAGLDADAARLLVGLHGDQGLSQIADHILV